jgi:hypothetical protein
MLFGNGKSGGSMLLNFHTLQSGEKEIYTKDKL